jgi:hypothetical protein
MGEGGKGEGGKGGGGKGEGGKRGSRRASATLPAITCDSPAMMKAIVAESDAIGLMPMSLIAREIAEGSLAVLAIDAPWLGRTFAIIELEDRALSPSAEQFLRFVRDADEAAAMSWRNDVIGVYSNSWGPDDDGQTLEGPGPATAQRREPGRELGWEPGRKPRPAWPASPRHRVARSVH